MNALKKTAIVVGILVIALAIFGFEKERYDYSDDGYDKGKGGGIGVSTGPAFEYAVTWFNSSNYGSWDQKAGTRSMQPSRTNGHAGMATGQRGAQGNFSEEYIFIFLRPVARWNN